jgi:hypothetical protein
MYGFKKQCKTLRQATEQEQICFNTFINHLNTLEEGQLKVNDIKPANVELPSYKIKPF